MGAGPTRALTAGRRTKPTSTGCRRLRQPEPGRRSTYQAGEPVQTNRASSEGFPLSVVHPTVDATPSGGLVRAAGLGRARLPGPQGCGLAVVALAPDRSRPG